MRKIDLSGQRFGALTVLKKLPPCGRNAYWVCTCDCGRQHVVRAGHLTSGAIPSCGCNKRRLLQKHGHAGDTSRSAEYRTWSAMIERCTNPRHTAFKNYGGRGITVCERWTQDFRAFYADMGDKPSPQHSIDRINNDGPYAPENCRWATLKEQAANKRRR